MSTGTGQGQEQRHGHGNEQGRKLGLEHSSYVYHYIYSEKMSHISD
jgi:hypothetical protein